MSTFAVRTIIVSCSIIGFCIGGGLGTLIRKALINRVRFKSEAWAKSVSTLALAAVTLLFTELGTVIGINIVSGLM